MNTRTHRNSEHTELHAFHDPWVSDSRNNCRPYKSQSWPESNPIRIMIRAASASVSNRYFVKWPLLKVGEVKRRNAFPHLSIPSFAAFPVFLFPFSSSVLSLRGNSPPTDVLVECCMLMWPKLSPILDFIKFLQRFRWSQNVQHQKSQWGWTRFRSGPPTLNTRNNMLVLQLWSSINPHVHVGWNKS